MSTYLLRQPLSFILVATNGHRPFSNHFHFNNLYTLKPIATVPHSLIILSAQPSRNFQNHHFQSRKISTTLPLLATAHSTSPSSSYSPGEKERSNFEEEETSSKELLAFRLKKEAALCFSLLDPSFENAKEAYKSKSNGDIVRALFVFRLCTTSFLVQNNQRILKGLRKLLGSYLFKRLLKMTVYGHFVGGENLNEVSRVVERLSQFGVKAIFDYSVESDISQEEAEEKAVQGIEEQQPEEQDQTFLPNLTHTKNPHHQNAGSEPSSTVPKLSRDVSMDGRRPVSATSESPGPCSDGAATSEQRSDRHDEEQQEEQIAPLLLPTTMDHSDKQQIELTHQMYTVHKEFGDRRMDVVSARTYFYESEKKCDQNADVICDSIDVASRVTHGSGFAAVKLTALGRPRLLLKLSEVIAQTENFFKALTGSTWETLLMSRINEDQFLQKLIELGVETDNQVVKDWFKTVDFDQDGFVDFFDWGRLLDTDTGMADLSKLFRVLNTHTGTMEPLVQNLTESEADECASMIARLARIADHGYSRGIRLMIDAEQSYFQPAISRLAIALMRKYNRQSGMVLNTYQAYLTNALDAIQLDMHLARREGFHFGCKLVRGAYMDQERKRAAAIGYADPINATYDETSRMYRQCLEAIVAERNRRGPGTVSVMVASHNEDSVRQAVEIMRANGIAPSERVVCFGQLYGMCDQVSFPLGQAGYSVYKYLPYGPVEDVLPYLSRRAQENEAMLKNVSKERRLLWTELRRRLRSGQWI